MHSIDAVARRPDVRRAAAAPLLAVLTLLALLSMVLSLGYGAEPIPAGDVVRALWARIDGVPGDPTHDVIIWDLRLPRTLLAFVVGAGLALAGVAIQTLVRNPLADPYLLGVSAGASVGATAVISYGVLAAAGVWALSLGALLGALLASLLVFGIALAQGGLTPLRLVLTGTVLSAAFSSVASFLVFKSAEPQAAQSVLFWLLGSLSGAQWNQVWAPSLVVFASAVALLGLSAWLDALAVGPDTASALGVPVAALRLGLFALVSVLVGVLVAVAGGIGFVGLVLPHLARLLVGARHRVTLPVSALMGGIFLGWVDVLSRIAVRPVELPLSVITGLIGAPVFLLLLGRRTYRFGGDV